MARKDLESSSERSSKEHEAPWLSLEEASREVRDEFHELAWSSTVMEPEEFSRRLDEADPKIFRVRNNKGHGLNFFDYVINQLYHSDQRRDATTPEEKAILADKVHQCLDIIIQKHPEQILRDKSSHNRHTDAWSEYCAAYSRYQDGGSAGVVRDVYLERLSKTYHLPEDDDSLLKEMQSGNYSPRPRVALMYAAYKNFPKSLAYALDKYEASDFWLLKQYSEWFPKIDQKQVYGALDKYAQKPLNSQQRMELCDLLARDVQGVWDVMKDFGRRVIAPTFLQIALDGKPPTVENFNMLDTLPSDIDIGHNLPQAIASRWLEDGASPTEILQRFDQLSRTWHHREIRFAPRGLHIPEELKRPKHMPEEECYSLLPEPYTTRDGNYVIRSYTKEKQFDKAHKILGTCVDTYWKDCKEGTSHVLAIESANGQLLSNVEIQLLPSGHPETLKHTFIPYGETNLVVMQHESQKINGEAQHVKSGPLHDALTELLRDISDKKRTVNTSPTGLTEETKAARDKYWNNSSYMYFIEATGYYPTPANIDRAFQEFKKEIRGGSVKEDENGRLVYATDRPHFVDGAVTTESGEQLSFKNMNAREWMRASGILEFFGERHWNQSIVHKLVAKELERPLTASLPAPLTDDQLAHAYHAGTVPKRELFRLSEAEQRSHAERIKEGERGSSPFFS